MTEFLERFPAEPYITAADRLGDDIAAFQLEWMQFEEGKDAIRAVAMDSLPRHIRWHLPAGWRHGAKGDFDTASAYGSWIVRLEELQPEINAKAKAVWAALEDLRPPVGWLPSGSDDPWIMEAFRRGWREA